MSDKQEAFTEGLKEAYNQLVFERTGIPCTPLLVAWVARARRANALQERYQEARDVLTKLLGNSVTPPEAAQLLCFVDTGYVQGHGLFAILPTLEAFAKMPGSYLQATEQVPAVQLKELFENFLDWCKDDKLLLLEHSTNVYLWHQWVRTWGRSDYVVDGVTYEPVHQADRVCNGCTFDGRVPGRNLTPEEMSFRNKGCEAAPGCTQICRNLNGYVIYKVKEIKESASLKDAVNKTLEKLKELQSRTEDSPEIPAQAASLRRACLADRYPFEELSVPSVSEFLGLSGHHKLCLTCAKTRSGATNIQTIKKPKEEA